MTETMPAVADGARCTLRHACTLLGCCYNTLRKHILAGDIHQSYYKNSTPYISGREIKRFWRDRI